MVKIRLLHTLAVETDGGIRVDLGSPKAQSLFAYLVLHHGERLDRRRLAFQLWARSSETAARRNLRQYLHRLRKSLEQVDPDGQWIQATGNHVWFEPSAGWSLDVEAFERLATPPNDDLAEAIALYAGNLLSDIYEDWVEPERERLARLYRECLLRLSERMARDARWEEAIAYGEKLVTAENLTESAHARLLKLYFHANKRNKLVQHYAHLENLYEQELGIALSSETQTLYQQLISGEIPAAPTISTNGNGLAKKRPISQTIPTSETPFIGRETLLATLDTAFDGMQSGNGHILIVQGELGVGKTRLVNEWLGRLEMDVMILQARAHEFENMIPYAPMREAFDVGHIDPAVWAYFDPPPPWLSALKPLLPQLDQHVTLPDETNQTHLIQALTSFLFALARHKPVLLVIDNLHWADANTWNMVAYLAQRIQAHRVLVVGTVRTEDLGEEATRLLKKQTYNQRIETVDIERLSADETAKLVTLLMHNDAPDPRFVRRLYGETKGNPFFIIETVQAVQEGGGDWTKQIPSDERGNRPAFAIPLSVQSVIESRLNTLSADSRAALSIAAAIGREFSFALLQQVSGFDTELLLDSLDEWLSRGFIREQDEGYDFTHEQLGHVAYNQLSRARRQWIHLRVAEYLTAQPNADPAQLAHHFYASSEPARALPYLTKAGQRALSVRSYAEAHEFGLRAIGLSGRFPISQNKEARLDLNLQLAQAYAFTGSIKQAQALLQETERLAEQIGDNVRLAHIIYQSSQLFWLRGVPKQANTYARRTLRYAEELDDMPMRLAALRMLGRTTIALSQFDDAIAFLLRYIDLSAESAEPVNDLAVVYGYLGVAYARVGSWQRAIDSAQRGVHLASVQARGATHVVACMQQAFIYSELREWETAIAVLEPVRETWRESGMSPHHFTMRIVFGRCLAQTGNVEAGLKEIKAALTWAESVDYNVFNYMGHLNLAHVLYLMEHEDAYTTAEKTIKLADQAGNTWASAVAHRTLAIIDMHNPHETDWQAAEHHLLTAMEMLRTIRARADLAHTYLTLRRLYDRAGQVGWAVDCHFRALTIFEELGMESELKIARGTAGQGKQNAVVIPGLNLRGLSTPD